MTAASMCSELRLGNIVEVEVACIGRLVFLTSSKLALGNAIDSVTSDKEYFARYTL